MTYPNTPGHQNTDTSKAAADAIEASLGHLQRMVLDAIRDAGSDGMTADEVAQKLRLSQLTVRPRATELARRGLVIDGGTRRKNESGRSAIVWEAA